MSYNPYSLEGKTILVTGASSGIGKATAVECSKLGAGVVITGRDEKRLSDTFSLLQGDSQPDIIVINGQRYWMQTLSRFSNKKGYSIRTSPNHSAIISCRKEGQNIQWYFTNASVDKNRPLTLY